MGVYIYALMHHNGGIRYIGRTAQDPAVRLSWHWRNCGHKRDYYHPKNMWLRSMAAAGMDPPEIRILAIVEDKGRNEDLPFIRAARIAFPGKLTNLYPCLPEDAPEWELFKRLQEYDPADFSYEEFRQRIAISTKAGRADVMRKLHAEGKVCSPEHMAKLNAARDEALRDISKYRANKQAKRDAELAAKRAERERIKREKAAQLKLEKDIKAAKSLAAKRLREAERAARVPMPQEERQARARAAMEAYWTPERRAEQVKAARAWSADYWTPERREEARRRATTPEALAKSRAGGMHTSAIMKERFGKGDLLWVALDPVGSRPSLLARTLATRSVRGMRGVQSGQQPRPRVLSQESRSLAATRPGTPSLRHGGRH